MDDAEELRVVVDRFLVVDRDAGLLVNFWSVGYVPSSSMSMYSGQLAQSTWPASVGWAVGEPTAVAVAPAVAVAVAPVVAVGLPPAVAVAVAVAPTVAVAGCVPPGVEVAPVPGLCAAMPHAPTTAVVARVFAIS